MTATDELRRMLDERGVEWSTNETLTDCWTRWNAGKFRCTATEINGTFAFTVGNSTPEQAVEATLGAGTCENISDPPEGFYCSSCGWGDFAEPSHLLTTAKFTDNECGPNYCPNCGRKVKR